MIDSIQHLTVVAIIAPLLGALMAGLCGKTIGIKLTHTVTIAAILVSLLCAIGVDYQLFVAHASRQVWDIYTWAQSGSSTFKVGFLVDHLSAVMMTVVTFVSLLVHIYSVGYMKGDSGYQRFFAYMSLFTFAMLVLVCANNLFLLFFGWEGVGLVSYLLIGFWYQRPAAAAGGFKAFLVNRVGDFGLILGIAMLFDQFGAVDYASIFSQSASLVGHSITIIPGHPWPIATVTCLLLFMGAMGKSAQMPLHVWLPESMEGPTPISALIHAATMVTAGIYLVARLSPLFELSGTSLNVVMVVGATTALFLGFVALVQTDIKRVIAYSTISQLGYMMAANGASAFSVAIFHLGTHACFKALLFLGAGSVICALHHEQDMRKMGGLRRYMPVTYVCMLIGSCALSAFPPFAGYYSKDAVIEAVHLSTLPGAQYAYWCLLIGAFVTALYTFRAFFMTFHGPTRMTAEAQAHVHESPWTICVPLVLLAVPSLLLGAVMLEPMLYAHVPVLSHAVTVAAQYNVLATMAKHYPGLLKTTFDALMSLPFWFAYAGFLMAYVAYIYQPGIPAYCAQRFKWVYRLLQAKLGFDAFNDWVFVKGTRRLSQFFYQQFDMRFIDRWVVHGSARAVNRSAWLMRLMQTGYVYHYALVLVLGMVVLLCVVLYGQ